jgi:hypothetical protein
VIKFVICGIEHSGTTLISDLFRQIKGVDAGFEVGVLLCDTPRAFRKFVPFSQNILKGWEVTPAELDHCCDTDQFGEFYQRLLAACKTVAAGTTITFDKTPRYLSSLDACMAKVDVPFIVSYKDPRAIVYSDFVRAKADSFDNWFRQYLPLKLKYMKSLYNQYKAAIEQREARTCFIALEDLCLKARESCDRIFAHVGHEFKLEYLVLQNLRYEHNRSTSISASIPFEYRKAFAPHVQQTIRTEFAACENWFYD